MKTFLTVLLVMFIVLPAKSQADEYILGIDKVCKTTDSLINNKVAGLVRIDTLHIQSGNFSGNATACYYNNQLIKIHLSGGGQGLSPQPYPGWYIESFYFKDNELVYSYIQCENPPDMQVSCGGVLGQHRNYFKANERYKPKTFGRTTRECGMGAAYMITKPTIEAVVARAQQYINQG